MPETYWAETHCKGHLSAIICNADYENVYFRMSNLCKPVKKSKLTRKAKFLYASFILTYIFGG